MLVPPRYPSHARPGSSRPVWARICCSPSATRIPCHYPSPAVRGPTLMLPIQAPSPRRGWARTCSHAHTWLHRASCTLHARVPRRVASTSVEDTELTGKRFPVCWCSPARRKGRPQPPCQHEFKHCQHIALSHTRDGHRVNTTQSRLRPPAGRLEAERLSRQTPWLYMRQTCLLSRLEAEPLSRLDPGSALESQH